MASIRLACIVMVCSASILHGMAGFAAERAYSSLACVVQTLSMLASSAQHYHARRWARLIAWMREHWHRAVGSGDVGEVEAMVEADSELGNVGEVLGHEVVPRGGGGAVVTDLQPNWATVCVYAHDYLTMVLSLKV